MGKSRSLKISSYTHENKKIIKIFLEHEGKIGDKGKINTTSVISKNQSVAKEQNQRLDVWLSQSLPDLSRSRIQNLIFQGNVRVIDEICTSKKTMVKGGDRWKITIPAAEAWEIKPNPIPWEILYEDEHLLIINKPAGLVVHPAPGHLEETMVNALLAYCDNLRREASHIVRELSVIPLDKKSQELDRINSWNKRDF